MPTIHINIPGAVLHNVGGDVHVTTPASTPPWMTQQQGQPPMQYPFNPQPYYGSGSGKPPFFSTNPFVSQQPFNTYQPQQPISPRIDTQALSVKLSTIKLTRLHKVCPFTRAVQQLSFTSLHTINLGVMSVGVHGFLLADSDIGPRLVWVKVDQNGWVPIPSYFFNEGKQTTAHSPDGGNDKANTPSDVDTTESLSLSDSFLNNREFLDYLRETDAEHLEISNEDPPLGFGFEMKLVKKRLLKETPVGAVVRVLGQSADGDKDETWEKTDSGWQLTSTPSEEEHVAHFVVSGGPMNDAQFAYHVKDVGGEQIEFLCKALGNCFSVALPSLKESMLKDLKVGEKAVVILVTDDNESVIRTGWVKTDKGWEAQKTVDAEEQANDLANDKFLLTTEHVAQRMMAKNKSTFNWFQSDTVFYPISTGDKVYRCQHAIETLIEPGCRVSITFKDKENNGEVVVRMWSRVEKGWCQHKDSDTIRGAIGAPFVEREAT